MPATDRLSQVFAALSDPTRRAILERLSHADATVGELAAPHAISQPAVSKHLRVLQQAGLVTQTARAQWRSNTLQPRPLSDATGWLRDLTDTWSQRLDRLDHHLTESDHRD